MKISAKLSYEQKRILEKLWILLLKYEINYLKYHDLRSEMQDELGVCDDSFHRSIRRLVKRGLLEKKIVPNRRGTMVPYYKITHEGDDVVRCMDIGKALRVR